MGAFDDLIPEANGGSAGAFGDLIPAKTGKKQAGAFDDLIPERPSMVKQIALENPATGVIEAGLNLATTGAALPVAGLAGLAVGTGNVLGLTERTGADTVNEVAEKLT